MGIQSKHSKRVRNAAIATQRHNLNHNSCTSTFGLPQNPPMTSSPSCRALSTLRCVLLCDEEQRAAWTCSTKNAKKRVQSILIGVSIRGSVLSSPVGLSGAAVPRLQVGLAQGIACARCMSYAQRNASPSWRLLVQVRVCSQSPITTAVVAILHVCRDGSFCQLRRSKTIH